MSELDAVDLLDLDAELTGEERDIRDVVRRFAQDRVAPNVAEWFEEGTFPGRELARELGDLNVLGMHLHGYGCAGANSVSYGLACRELEAVDGGIRSFTSVQGSLVMFPIHAYGTEEQKEQWLPRLARGEAVGCFGLTEPDHGSDPRGMITNAKRDGSDWVINGSKMWITNGGIADVAVIWAKTDDGINGFLVPTDTPGFEAHDIHRKLSMRASVTSELVLEDCRVPADSVLPEAKGLKAALSCLAEARFGIVWATVGSARSCFETALEYAKTRVQFGRPIAGFQLTQRKLADMAVELNKSMLLALRLARLKDEGRLTPQQVSIGKLNNVREALEIAREARTILGGSGISSEYPVMRHMANLESVLTYEGTSEIHTLIIGEALTGLRAYS